MDKEQEVLLNTMLATYVGFVFTVLLLAVILYLKNKREPLYKYNVGYWLALLASLVMQGAVEESLMASPFAMGVAHFLYIHPYTRLISLTSAVPLKSKRYYFAIATSLLLSLILLLVGAHFIAVTLPVTLGIAFTIVDPLRIVFQKSNPTFSFKVIAVLFILTAIHDNDYAFLRDVAEFAPYGFGFALFLNLGVSISIPSLILERIKDNYSHSLESTVEERTRDLRLALEKLKATQTQLVEREKMASLGELVAGVAHEINNPVGFSSLEISNLLGDIETAESKIATGIKKSDLTSLIDAGKRSCKLVGDSLARVSALVSSFKQIAVDLETEQQKEIDLVAYLKEFCENIRPTLSRKKINIQIASDDHQNALLNTFPGGLTQVLTNLLVNSMKHGFDEAKGGTIDIRLETEPHQYTIVYMDDGYGIADANAEKVFIPFFTTKPGALGGSGLGMSIAFNIVTNRLGGQIKYVHPGNYQGVRFEISLPKDHSNLTASANSLTSIIKERKIDD